MGTLSDVSTALTEDASDAESEGARDAVKLLRRLQRENRQLAGNFERLKGLHLQLASSHNQLQSDHESLQQERAAIERQYQQLCESWREELDAKQRDFDEAMRQLAVPVDLDLLRVQLLEEVEAPHRDKCERLAREAEGAQEAFVRLRREHEALITSHKALEQRCAAELQLVRLETDAAEAAMGQRLAGHAQLQERVSSLEQQLRTSRRDAADAASQLRRAREEADELRAAKEAAVVEREQGLIKAERGVKQLASEAAEARGMSEGLARKARHLQAELDDSTRAQEAMHLQLMSLQASHTSLSAQLADAKAAAARERGAAADRGAAAEAQWRERIGKLMQESLDKDRRLAELALQHQQELADAGRDAETRAAAAEERAAAAARAAAEAAAAAAARVEAAEQAAAEWQQRALQADCRSTGDLAAARKDADEARAALGSTRQLADALQRELADSRAMLGGLEEHVTRGGEWGSAGGRAPSDPGAARAPARPQRAHGSCGSIGEAGAAGAEAGGGTAGELEALRREFAAARAEWEKRSAAARRAWEAEREALESKHQAQLRKLRDSARDQVRALQDKLRAHKARASDLSSEVAALRIGLHESDLGARSPGAAAQHAQHAAALAAAAAVAGGGGGSGSGGAPPGALAAAGPAGPAGSLSKVAGIAAALASMRQRQEAYLGAL